MKKALDLERRIYTTQSNLLTDSLASPRHAQTMATARALIPQPGVAGTFHCVSRCVRRSWLCGIDPYSGQSYEHRREWIEQRSHLLAEIFAVGIHSYAVMSPAVISSTVHIVIRVEPGLTTDWTDQRVAERGVALHCPAKFSDQARRNRIEAWRTNPDRMAALRVKLGSLSYFMQALNQPIAIAANKEDGCTGTIGKVDTNVSDWKMNPRCCRR